MGKRPLRKKADLGKFNAEDVKEPEVYRFAYTNFLHQDTLSWSRTQAIVVIELAALAGSYSTRKEPALIWTISPSSAALIGSSILIFLIWRLIVRDQKIRDHFLPQLDAVHDRFNLWAAPECYWFNTGRWIIRFIVFGLILGNAALAWLYWPK